MAPVAACSLSSGILRYVAAAYNSWLDVEIETIRSFGFVTLVLALCYARMVLTNMIIEFKM